MSQVIALDDISAVSRFENDRIAGDDACAFEGVVMSYIGTHLNVIGAIDDNSTLIFDRDVSTGSIKNMDGGWIAFSISLFPDARLFTKEEQKKFEEHKRNKFQRFKLDF